jgi:autophagy-related protein 9
MVPKCTKNMWGIWNLGLWICCFYVIWKTIQFALDIPRLMHIRDFYMYLLEIPEEDMQTVSWQDVVAKVTGLRDQNVKTASNITPSQRQYLTKQLGKHMVGQAKERLDAHDIANRLMRRENYIIALFNKDVLDLTASIPFMRNRQFFSRTLLWTLQFSILDLVFNDANQVRPQILKSDHRGQLSRDLRNRFKFAATMNLIFAPFVAAFLLIDFIFTYYNVRTTPCVQNAVSHQLTVNSRSSKQTHRLLVRASTPRWRSGSSGSSTSCLIFSENALTCRTHSPSTMSTSFPK